MTALNSHHCIHLVGNRGNVIAAHCVVTCDRRACETERRKTVAAPIVGSEHDICLFLSAGLIVRYREVAACPLRAMILRKGNDARLNVTVSAEPTCRIVGCVVGPSIPVRADLEHDVCLFLSMCVVRDGGGLCGLVGSAVRDLDGSGNNGSGNMGEVSRFADWSRGRRATRRTHQAAHDDEQDDRHNELAGNS